jgi:hypothetical protein
LKEIFPCFSFHCKWHALCISLEFSFRCVRPLWNFS